MKIALWIGIPVILILGAIVVVALRPTPSVITKQQNNIDITDTSKTTQSETSTIKTAAGRYQTYSADLLNDTGYPSTILFFYAAWCPECRAFDQSISGGTIPDGVQILRVTYDDSQDLRQKYSVTIQSTFVRVNASGDKQVLWSGYGKDKSISTIIENTK